MICEEINTTEIIEVKRCSKCGEIKPLVEFGFKNKQRGVRRSGCRLCYSKYTRQYNALNREKRNKYQAEYQRKNASSVNARNRKHRKSHPHKSRSYTSAYRSRKLGSCPAWLCGAQLIEIRRRHEDAWWISHLTGVPHQVDHIHPLKGKGFSGLHVPWNLSVITKAENMAKCNRPPKNEEYLFWNID